MAFIRSIRWYRNLFALSRKGLLSGLILTLLMGGVYTASVWASEGSFKMEDYDDYSMKKAPDWWGYERNFELRNATGAPQGSVVTKIEYKFLIDDTGGEIYFWCSDYAVGLLSHEEYIAWDDLCSPDPKCPGYLLPWVYLWRRWGGKTDMGYDDDPADDTDIDIGWLSDRSTDYFNGVDPNKPWHMHFRNMEAHHSGVLKYHGLRIYWQNNGPYISSVSTLSNTHPVDEWNTTSNLATFTWAATDLNGLAGYSVMLDHEPGTVPNTTQNTGVNSMTIEVASDSEGWYFHVHGVDGLGNWGGDWGDNVGHYGPFYVDTAWPYPPVISSPTHPDENTWYLNDRPEITWTVPPDGTSPINGYSYVLDRLSSTTPDTTSEGVDELVLYDEQASGTWYFHVRARDLAGNWGFTGHYQINIDTAGPPAPVISSPTHPGSIAPPS